MILKSDSPIGIFDSGVGGLTLANAIRQVLPKERIIYFGDTAHLPYGDKSKETIINYSKLITAYLISQNCKIIVFACNTASANAFDTIIKEVNNQTILIDVINPVIDFILSFRKYKHVGVIGTKATIQSGIYVSKIVSRNPHISVSSISSPLLVPMIEEGFIFDDISNAIIRSYLAKSEFENIDALLLGCTHYPIIKNQIKKYFNFNVDVIDSSQIVADKVLQVLENENLLNTDSNERPNHRFLVSDLNAHFQDISKLFFEDDILLERISIF